MLRIIFIVVHLIELALYSGIFLWLGGGGFLHWLTTVLCLGLLLRALLIVITMLIAKVPLRPLTLTAAASAAEFYATVRLYSFDSLITGPRHLIPQSVTNGIAVPDNPHLPVLFVHGFTCNSGFWRVFLKHGSRRWNNHIGTINLEPLHGCIDQYSAQIDARIDELLQASNSSQCLIVAHSMGGLAVRSYLRNTQAKHKIKGVITLGTPHTGTLLAHFSTAPNARQMRRFNDWLSALRESETVDNLPPFEAMIGTHDNIVAPRECATFELANNTYFPGVTHLAMAYNQPLIDWTYTRLERLSRSS